MHGGEHLDVADGIQPEVTGNLPLAEVDHRLRHPFGIGLFDEIKLGQFVGTVWLSHDRRLAVADPMGVDHDGTQFVLAKNFGQFEGRDRPGADQVREHVSRPHRRQLEYVPHQDQGGGHRYGSDQLRHEQGVHHGCFVHDNHIGC
jgi:hypothetical protein